MNTKRNPDLMIFILFFLSGISGLMYEILWARSLSNIFGSSTIANSIIIALFMGGLASGSYLAAIFIKKSDKNNLCRVYALIELSIALTALLVFYTLPMYQHIYNNYIDLTGSGSVAINLARFLLIFVIIIIPTTLMGSTLPIISQILVKDRPNAGKLVGFLYAINTLGAIAGIYFVGFYSILKFGVTASFYFAAAINIFISIVFFFKGSEWEVKSAKQPAVKKHITNPNSDRHKYLPSVILLSYALSGFTTMALEVVWTRALVFFVGSSTYAFSIILIVFLLGISLGSFVISLFVDKLKKPVFTFGIMELVLGSAALVSAFVIFKYSSSPVFNQSTLDPIFLSSLKSGIFQIFTASLLVIILPTLIMGAIFPVVNKIILEESNLAGNAVGRIYSANTFGTIFGSLAAGFIFIPLIGVTKSIMVFCFINLFLGLFLLVFSGSSKTKILSYTFGFVFIVIILFIIFPADIRFKSDTEKSSDNILYYKEDVSATVAIFEDEKGYRSMSINGMMIGGNQTKSLRKEMMLAHLPMLLHNNPKSVLTIGLGTGITFSEASLYNPDNLECVEIIKAVRDGAQLFKKDNLDIINNKNAHIYIEDGRNFLSTVKKKYDVIIDDSMLRRESAGNGPLYAFEYYKDISNHLNKNGLFCQWLPLYLEKDIYKSILKTVKYNFKYVTLWYLGHAAVIQIASNDEIKIDLKQIQQKMLSPVINTHLKKIEMDDAETLVKCFLLDNDRIEQFCSNARINSDDKPYVEFMVPLQNSSQVIFGDNLLEMAPMRPNQVPLHLFTDFPGSQINYSDNKWNNFHLILRGSILHHLDKEEESFYAYLKAFELDSNDKNAKYFLGIGRGETPQDRALAFVKIGDYFKASKYFDKALYYYNESFSIDNSSISALNSISNLYFELGDYKSAIMAGEKAVEIEPSNVSLLFNLGTYYEEMKNFGKAKYLYDKCLALNPLFSYAKDRLEKMNIR